MTGGSLGLRTGSYGSLQSQSTKLPNIGRKTSASTKMLSSYREKERFLPMVYRYSCRRRVAMLLLVSFAFLVFILGSLVLNKESTSPDLDQHIPFGKLSNIQTSSVLPRITGNMKNNFSSTINAVEVESHISSRAGKLPSPPPRSLTARHSSRANVVSPSRRKCDNFAFPPPPPAGGRRIGPRPCPVCYIPVEEAIAAMPSSLSESPVLQNLTYVLDQNPTKTEPHGGSDFGGYPSLKHRSDSFEIKESMTVHCGFVRGSRPGHQTGFDIDEADIVELEQFHEVIVASAIFGNYDLIQQPRNIGEVARKNIPFYMFIDEETEAYMKNSSLLNDSKRIGLWRIIVVHNIPYTDARRNGKVPKLLLHRILPNVRYSIWIDGKLQLVVDPYQVLERFLWRQNASFAISRHYRRFDVFEEAEANKAAGKYDNASIDHQIEFYKNEGLTPYSEAKLPITSDVPEGCVIMREHIPITNLFTCLWFNEVDRFTSRDQISFSTVRDKVMGKVNWSVNMFLDCERRNFVIQAYHRELLEHMPPPAVRRPRNPPPSPLHRETSAGKTSGKVSSRRGKDKRSLSRRHRKSRGGSALKMDFGK